jgi:hypothetical protein
LTIDDAITPAQAEALLEQYDAGEIPILTWPNALTPAEQGIDDRIVLAALLFLAVGMGIPSADPATVVGLPAQARRLQRNGQIALAEALQSAYDRDVARLAERYLSGQITLPIWQSQMGDAVRRHLIAQSAAGRGRLDLEELTRLQQLSREEIAYLSRFADTLAHATVMGNGWSRDRIIRRAQSYAGTARGEFWRGLEAAEIEEDPDDLAGYVVDYESQDDPRTCGPCLDAEMGSPYRPGFGPFPGQVCLGGDLCRCTRTLRWDPDAYAALVD